MDENQILSIVNRNFPNAQGVILTGSQIKLEAFDKKRDLDIVVISSEFSSMSSLVVTLEEVLFDFTMISLNNLENMLFNESYDSKGILLTMLMKGKILKDTDYGITKAIKKSAELLHHRKQVSTSAEYKQSINQLKKIRVCLDRNLEKHERFFLAVDFIHIVSNIEIFKDFNWLLGSKQKPKYLFEKSPKFIEHLLLVTNFSLHNISDIDIKNISNFIDFYLKNSEEDEGKSMHNDRCVLDIDYSERSAVDFCNNVLPEMLLDPVLKDSYLYFYFSDKRLHRIYQNKISIVFSSKITSEKELCLSLLDLFSKKLNRNIKISTTASACFDSSNPNFVITHNFEIVFKVLNKAFIENAKLTEKDTNIQLALFLIGFLVKHLEIEAEDLAKVNEFIIDKWLLQFEDQKKMKWPKDLYYLRMARRVFCNSYFTKSKTALSDQLEKGFNHMDDQKDISIEQAIINNLKFFFTENKKAAKKIAKKNELTLSLFKNKLDIQNFEPALMYLLTVEQIVRALDIDSVKRCAMLLTTADWVPAGSSLAV